MAQTSRDEHRPSEAEVETARMDDPGFHNAMAHLYRGEMHRMTTWRIRLDTTTNWAILLSTAMTTFTLGSSAIPHYSLLLSLSLIGICLVIEARRCQYLLHSQWRIQVLEAHYFTSRLVPAHSTDNWRARLAADLFDPRLTIGWLTALRFRMRRNYLMIIFFVTGVWLTKVFIHPHSPESMWEFYARLAVSDLIPSWFVAWTAAIFVGTSCYLAVTSPNEESLGLASERQVALLALSYPPKKMTSASSPEPTGVPGQQR